MPTPEDATAVAALLERGPDIDLVLPGHGPNDTPARHIAADDEGDPDDPTVLYLHGTPDSRLARHPDATILRHVGARLLAVDRPGFGHSTFDPGASPGGYGHDLDVLLDHLGLDSVHLLAWSAGAIWALGTAVAVRKRVESVTIVGGLVPFEAFNDPDVRDAAGDARLGMVETAEDLGAEIAAEMIAPMLVPDPCTPASALEHRSESGDLALSNVPGADMQMAAACCDAVRNGNDGLIRDVTVQLSGSGIDFTAITAPVRLITGELDATCPPAFARWLASRLPAASVEVVDGAGHGLLMTHWEPILKGIVQR